jgi:allophanate hydrolase subunit 2
VSVRIIPGPQDDHFTRRGLDTLISSEYKVSSASNRTGYRLVGSAVEYKASADIVSDGIPLGAIQVPGDGQLIIMMADRPTTGGYAKIATVISADIPVLAQLLPGASRVRFEITTIEKAQACYREQLDGLAKALGMAVRSPSLVNGFL